MKTLITLFLLFGLFNSAYSQQATFDQLVYETTSVERVGSSFVKDRMCVYLGNGQIVSLDLTSEVGKAEFSISLAALASNKNLTIGFDESGSLLSGCNSGTTIRPHAILTIKE